MTKQRYTEEFKRAAVKQTTDEGYSVQDVATRLGITTKSLYNWRARYGESEPDYLAQKGQNDELKALKAELKRVTMERDILKEAAVFFAGESKKNTRL